MPLVVSGVGEVVLIQKIVRTGPNLGVPAEVVLVCHGMLDPPQRLLTYAADLRIVHGGLYRAIGMGLAGTAQSPMTGDISMESIQVPDEVTVQVDMREVQVHV